ncbi:MAG TPA: hypothetical protein VN783_15635 [Thermoanaerobaculia bacterium]|nr:hypothetical protein [Thermoanaerobaculia bacterium]
MPNRLKKEDLTYLKRYGKTKSLSELAHRFKTDEKTVRAALVELGVVAAAAKAKKAPPAPPAPRAPRPGDDPLAEDLAAGLKLLHKQEWKKAAAAFEKVIAGDDPALTARARQFLAIAKQRLATAEDEKPADAFLDAVMLRNRGDSKASLEIARRGARDKKDERFAFLVASIHASEGRLEEAAKALAQAIELNPKNRIHAFHDADFAELRRASEHRHLFELP